MKINTYTPEEKKVTIQADYVAILKLCSDPGTTILTTTVSEGGGPMPEA